jgi:branched-chain amino acid transport system ATP-binding protein
MNAAAAAPEPLLAVSALSKSFGGVQAVRDVTFSLARGEMLAMIGPNGAGKSTCFNLLNGQLPMDRGDVRLQGRSIARRKPRDIWRLGVGRTFQVTATFASMTVRENVQMALLSHHRRLRDWFSRARDAHGEEADRLLALVGMDQQAQRACSVLAYGDLKRVELAVALANAPGLLLMDEPAAGMAPRERVELMALVSAIVKREQIGVLFTEHDMDVVFGSADRVIVLSRGVLIADGTPAQVRADPEVQRVYLGSRSHD